MPSLRFCLLAILLLMPATAWGATTRPSVEDKLLTQIDELSLDGLTLPDLFVKIADKTRLNIVAEWKAMELAGIDLTKKLHGRVMDLTAREVLLVGLSQAGAPPSPDSLTVDGNLLRISSAPRTVTKVYPIGKLIDAEKKAHGPTTRTSDEQQTAAVDAVITLIGTIDVETWRDAGGTVGAISSFGRQLIITQTPAGHVAIENLLRDLEKSDAN